MKEIKTLVNKQIVFAGYAPVRNSKKIVILCFELKAYILVIFFKKPKFKVSLGLHLISMTKI